MLHLCRGVSKFERTAVFSDYFAVEEVLIRTRLQSVAADFNCTSPSNQDVLFDRCCRALFGTIYHG